MFYTNEKSYIFIINFLLTKTLILKNKVLVSFVCKGKNKLKKPIIVTVYVDDTYKKHLQKFYPCCKIILLIKIKFKN